MHGNNPTPTKKFENWRVGLAKNLLAPRVASPDFVGSLAEPQLRHLACLKPQTGWSFLGLIHIRLSLPQAHLAELVDALVLGTSDYLSNCNVFEALFDTVCQNLAK